MVILLWHKKKRRERVKIWTAVDRRRNKVIAYEISKDSNHNDKYHCRRLLDNIKKDYYIIDIMATDNNNNYSYNEIYE